MKAWAVELARHCHPPKAERKRKGRIIGNVVEDLSRLLAPLL
jgi:cardiolipin synthase